MARPHLGRYVLGVRPLEAGFTKILIAPRLGPLRHVEGIVPTPRGPVMVKCDGRRVEVEIPPGTSARVKLEGSEPVETGLGRHIFDR